MHPSQAELARALIATAMLFGANVRAQNRSEEGRLVEKPLEAWQLSGIRAAFGDLRVGIRERSVNVQGEALELCVVRGWGRALDPRDLAAQLRSEDPRRQLAAIRALGQSGIGGAAHAADLEALLSSADGASRYRLEAWTALTKMAKDGAVFTDEVASTVLANDAFKHPPFTLMVDDAEFVLTTNAAGRDLVDIHFSASPNSLDPYLRDGRPGIRREAALALGRMGPAAAPFTNDLEGLLSDNASDVRQAAVKALANVGSGNRDVAKRISALFEDPDRDVRSEVIAALGKIHCPASLFNQEMISALRAPDIGIRIDALSALQEMDDKGVMFLGIVAEMLHSEEKEIRQAALYTLIEMGNSAAPYAKEFAALLRDKDSSTRAAAVKALGRVGTEASVYLNEIIALLGDQDGTVRFRAVEALCRLGGRGIPVRDAVSKVMEKASPQTRAEFAENISRSGPVGGFFLPELCRLAADEDFKVRVAAVEALEELAPPDDLVARVLANCLHDGGGLGMVAAKALGKMGEVGATKLDDLLAALGRGPRYFTEAVVDALATMGRAGYPVAERLLPLLRNPDLQESAASVFAKMGKAGAPYVADIAPLLLRAAWKTAADAIDQWGNAEGDLALQAKFLAGAYAVSADGVPAFRAHLRLWSGGNADLQQLVTWVGRPDVEPMSKDGLTADEARETLELFLRFWDHTADCSVLRKELSDRIAEAAKAVAGKADAETSRILRGLAAKLKEAPDEVEDFNAVEGAIDRP